MKEAFIDFEWHVLRRYEWRDWLDENQHPIVVPDHGLASLETVELAWGRYDRKGKKVGPVLTAVRGGGEARTYHPMQREHATLFREFAGIDYKDKSAILAFASEY